MEDLNKITYFAETDFRNKKTPFGIKALDRARHVYVIGKTGMGKSTLLENMAAQDILDGNGIAFIDPHGGSIDKFLDYVPENRIDDVIYFAPFDTEHPIAFNVMENVDPEKRHLVAQGLLSSFKKIWGEETFSDRMEHITSNTILALLEYPNSTMLSMPRMFTDNDFQKEVVSYVTDPSVKAFWEKEYAAWDDRYRKDAYSAVLNKVGQFTSNSIIRNIVGQVKSSFDFRNVMDTRKILLINLSIGQIGESNANLLGSMMTTKIFLAAMSRADLSPGELAQHPNFYLHIDEFQNLANDSFADILSQARKYKLNLTMAHQYIEQMPEVVRFAVFGNVGTMIVFRVGSFDAEIFEKEFSPVFLMDDIVNLGFAQIYLKLMIDGVGSTPFSARTLPPIKKQGISFRDEIVAASRNRFTRPKTEVEKEIKDWHEKSFKVKKVVSNEKEGAKPSEGAPQKRFEGNSQKYSANKAPTTTTTTTTTTATKAMPTTAKVTPTPMTPTTPSSAKRPVLEGKNSLKEALSGAMDSISRTKGEDVGEKKKILEKQDTLNKDIEKSNKEKLKETLKKALKEAEEDKKASIPKKEEELREVPEKILREILGS